jgi:hypothetical protein
VARFAIKLTEARFFDVCMTHPEHGEEIQEYFAANQMEVPALSDLSVLTQQIYHILTQKRKEKKRH